MPTTPTSADHDADDRSQAFYVRVMTRLNEAGVPFLVGGAFALARFTGIERNTKDFDIFVRREDIERTLAARTDDTCSTELCFPHWHVMHLFLRCGEKLDWDRMLRRFGDHWRVLFAHVAMFNFVYPGEHTKIPQWVTEHLLARMMKETREPRPNQHICRGPFLSRAQYLIDIQLWGHKDARLGPQGFMSHDEVKQWTAAIHEPKPEPNLRDPIA